MAACDESIGSSTMSLLAASGESCYVRRAGWRPGAFSSQSLTYVLDGVRVNLLEGVPNGQGRILSA